MNAKAKILLGNILPMLGGRFMTYLYNSVLFRIILDSTSAAEQIPKDVRGRLITGDGTVFQDHLFDEGPL